MDPMVYMLALLGALGICGLGTYDGPQVPGVRLPPRLRPGYDQRSAADPFRRWRDG